MENGKGKSIKLLCDFSREGSALIEDCLLDYTSSPEERAGVIAKPKTSEQLA